MGRHSAPEPPIAESGGSFGSVVRMSDVRRSRHSQIGRDQAQGDLLTMLDDLTLITADDQLLDCIAAGQGDHYDLFGSQARVSLAPLLATWRSDVIDAKLPQLPSVAQTELAVRRSVGHRTQPSRRALRPIIGIAAAMCALLMGSAAVGAQSAQPGDTLWPLTQVLYADHAASLEAGAQAKKNLDSAQVALSSGDATKALVALTEASGQLDLVDVRDGRIRMVQTYQSLLSQATSSIQVLDPAATVASPARTTKAAASPNARPAVASTGRTPTTRSAAASTSKTANSSVTKSTPTVTTPGTDEVPVMPVVPVVPTSTTPGSTSAGSDPTPPSTSAQQPSTTDQPSSPDTPTSPTAVDTPTPPTTPSDVSTSPSTTSEMPVPTTVSPQDQSSDQGSPNGVSIESQALSSQ